MTNQIRFKTRKLECACCGQVAPAFKQWWNRDTGYGVCVRCFREAVEKEGMDAALSCYGKPGLHHSINLESEVSNG